MASLATDMSAGRAVGYRPIICKTLGMSRNSGTLGLSGDWYRNDPSNSTPGVLDEIPGRGLVLTVLGSLSALDVGSTLSEVLGSASGRDVVLTRARLDRSQR